MAVAKIECPECGAVLRPAKPVPPGKKVRCPRCESTFVVPGGEEERPARRAAAGRAAGSPRTGPATRPEPEKKKPAEDDEEGGTYGLLKDPDEDEGDEEKASKKPRIEYVPDLKVKNPTGPATAALAKPSNFILVKGSLLCVSGLLSLCVATWPFMFTKWGTGVKPSQAERKYKSLQPQPKNQQQQGGGAKKEEESAPNEDEVMERINKDSKMRAVWEDMVEEDRMMRIWWAAASVGAIVLGAFMALSAVKMMNLESYRWSWVAAVLAIVSGLAVPWGIWSIVLLRREEIKAAFEYKPE